MLGPLIAQFNSTAAVHRIADVADTDRTNYAVHIAAVPGLLIPLEGSFGEDLEGSFGQDSQFVCLTADIKENDKMQISNIWYRVVSVKPYQFMDSGLMDLIIRRFND